ncbi:SLC13 family permease [Rhizorhapis sp. SPR117]|uniref:SLC13 family permease n=1 Tax=Rhizorhapis sp. SPR117 TaxID=2912611 RepID=UPI001F1EAF3A|nr:SLC13 family permease [Rhizorhapis sp. SPR117]
MNLIPSAHATAALLLACAMFYGFASGRVRVEIISLLTIGTIALGLYFLPLPGQQPKDGLELAFAGFGHHALITICALMIMGRGLVVTGALNPAARTLTRLWQYNQGAGFLITLLLAFGMSMLINDTPVLVLLLPILVQLASNGGLPASKTLMPVNAAILIGGMASSIGTSTNLLVVSIANDLGMPPISVFHFAPVVLLAALVALPYIWLIMPRLLPDNSPQAGHKPRTYSATFRLIRESALHGLSIDEVRAKMPADFAFDPGTSGPLAQGMRIGVSGSQDAINEAARLLGGSAAPGWLIDRLQREAQQQGEDITVVEMAISADSRLVDKTLQTAGLQNVAVLGIHQSRRLLHETRVRNAEAPLGEGDVLLVMGMAKTLQEFAQADGLLMLEGAKELPRTAKSVLAIAIMGGSVALASVGFLPIAISALGGAVLMFITGCVKFDRVGRALSAKVIVLIAASIAIGRIVLESGAAEWMGQLLALGLQFLPAAGVLAAIMLFVTILTNFASNATAAAVGTPIAFSLAQQLNLPVEPLVLAVLFGCNLCYATPVAYQTNMLIMGEGEYTFNDYIRTGVPLVAIMIVALSTILMLRYGL